MEARRRFLTGPMESGADPMRLLRGRMDSRLRGNDGSGAGETIPAKAETLIQTAVPPTPPVIPASAQARIAPAGTRVSPAGRKRMLNGSRRPTHDIP